MKRYLIASVAAAALFALALNAATAATVTSKKTCLQAVADAREGLAAASIAQKTHDEVADMIRISEHLCGEANFVYAETLLAVARGMTAEE